MIISKTTINANSVGHKTPWEAFVLICLFPVTLVTRQSPCPMLNSSKPKMNIFSEKDKEYSVYILMIRN